jgi:MerR family transcriptional regulator, light-induced transcriptional regulator
MIAMAGTDDDPTTRSEKPEFSIRVVSRLTSLSTDTLRIWERRYGYPKPVRADSGSRLYSRRDIERLTLLSRGLKFGFRIGEMVSLDDPTLKQRLAQTSHDRLDSEGSTLSHDLVDCVIADEIDALRARLRRTAAMLGTKRFIAEVASPLLHELGDAWEQGILEVHQEHSAMEVLQSQLHAMSTAYEGTEGPVVVLATLPRETHGIGLQLAGLYLAACGALPRIVGVDTPPPQIAKSAAAFKADAVAISVSVAASSVAVTNHLNHLLTVLDAQIPLWLGGNGATRLAEVPERARLVTHWDELEDALLALREQP